MNVFRAPNRFFCVISPVEAYCYDMLAMFRNSERIKKCFLAHWYHGFKVISDKILHLIFLLLSYIGYWSSSLQALILQCLSIKASWTDLFLDALNAAWNIWQSSECRDKHWKAYVLRWQFENIGRFFDEYL